MFYCPAKFQNTFIVQSNSRTYVLVPAKVQDIRLGPDKFFSYPISVEDSLFIPEICRGRSFNISRSRLGPCFISGWFLKWQCGSRSVGIFSAKWFFCLLFCVEVFTQPTGSDWVQWSPIILTGYHTSWGLSIKFYELTSEMLKWWAKKQVIKNLDLFCFAPPPA